VPRHVQLWHYTCDHAHAAIGAVGTLHTIGVARYIWLTDLAEPDRDALGLTMRLVTCDRTAHRYRVMGDPIVYRYSDVRLGDFTATERDGLEGEPGALLRHWWIAPGPVPVLYDPIPARAARRIR